jgi:hypothetical protein
MRVNVKVLLTFQKTPGKTVEQPPAVLGKLVFGMVIGGNSGISSVPSQQRVFAFLWWLNFPGN